MQATHPGGGVLSREIAMYVWPVMQKRFAANLEKSTHHRCKILRKLIHNGQKCGHFEKKMSIFHSQ